MRLLIASVFAIGALAVCEAARADDDESHREWFGYQTLAVDTALIAAWATYPMWHGFNGDGGLLILDVMAYTVVSPLIHMAHDSDQTNLSVALRLALPSLGLLVGFGIGTSLPCTCGPNDWFCWCGLSNGGMGAFDGSITGAALASIIDAVALAWERRKPKETHVGASWSLSPFGLRGGGGLSAGCRF